MSYSSLPRKRATARRIREPLPGDAKPRPDAAGSAAPRKRRGKTTVPPKLRAAVMERDGGCVGARHFPAVRCRGRLDPHHIEPKGMGGRRRAETMADLVTLCRAHHDHVHDHPLESETHGLLRRRSRDVLPPAAAGD